MGKIRSKKHSKQDTESKSNLEQVVQYEKRIYDLEQLLDIAKSFCQNLDFGNLLESIVYICLGHYLSPFEN